MTQPPTAPPPGPPAAPAGRVVVPPELYWDVERAAWVDSRTVITE
jgi:hypothetical protein